MECEIIDSIESSCPFDTITTPCGKFLIILERYSIFRYCLETKQKVRIAGSDQSGYQDGTRNESRFNCLLNVTFSKYGKTLFVADSNTHVIRAICVETGVTTTFAGKFRCSEIIDGPKEIACFISPYKLKLSPDGNTLYISDMQCLRSICIATGQVNTVCKCIIENFTFHPDGKHIYIINETNFLEYNIDTFNVKIVFKFSNLYSVTQTIAFSKYGPFGFYSEYKSIQVFNISTNETLGMISLPFYVFNFSLSSNKMYICDNTHNKIQVLDICKYNCNVDTFTRLQLSKHSFLSQLVINSLI
jgi:DNA-binding beta-propeller fold protein YncE